MKKLHFFPLLLAIVFAGCAHDSNNTVVIHSVPADSIFTEIGIYASPLSTRPPITFKGGTTCRFEIDTVETCSFRCFNGNRFFATQVFITQGDSVSFKTAFKDEDSYEIIFEGKNAAHYNYSIQQGKNVSWEGVPNYYDPDINLLEYKRQLLAVCDKEYEFLRNYKKKYTVSTDFINYVSAEINNVYAYSLYLSVFYNKCKIIPEGYLDDVVIIQNPLSFATILALKYKYIYCSPDENIERMYNVILNEVHPKFHSSLLSEWITYFAQKGDRNYKKSLLQVMSQIEKTSTDSTLLATVQEYRPICSLSETLLPDSILDNTYLRSYQSEQKITLRQLFDNYKNTAIFLDFWASDCVPCRRDIKESAIGKSYLTDKKIAVIYISGDGNVNAWLKAAKNDGITENQYLLCDDFWKSLLTQYLKINRIPRYVLFNKNHEIEILSAPRPVDCELEKLKKIIERNPEKFINEKSVANTNIAKKEVQKKLF